MFTKHKLEQENQGIINRAKTDKKEYFAILSTMSRFHKYTLPQQLGLKTYAPENFTACATKDQWEHFMGRNVAEGALGIPLIEDNPFNGEPVRMVYDISDTVTDVPMNKNVLWQFDESKHNSLFQGYIGGDGSIPQKIAYMAEQLSRSNRAVKPIDRALLGHSLGAILLERLGYNPEAYLEASFTERNLLSHDIEKVLVEANRMSRDILKIIEDYVKAERKEENERAENPLLRNLGRINGIVHENGKTEKIHQNARERGTYLVSGSGTGNIQQESFDFGGAADDEGERNGRSQSQGSDGMGRSGEQYPAASTGNPPSRDAGAINAQDKLKLDAEDKRLLHQINVLSRNLTIEEQIRGNAAGMAEALLRWDEISHNGGGAFNTDGEAMNLVRNHIFSFQSALQRLAKENHLEVPAIVNHSIPPEMDHSIMIRGAEHSDNRMLGMRTTVKLVDYAEIEAVKQAAGYVAFSPEMFERELRQERTIVPDMPDSVELGKAEKNLLTYLDAKHSKEPVSLENRAAAYAAGMAHYMIQWDHLSKIGTDVLALNAARSRVEDYQKHLGRLVQDSYTNPPAIIKHVLPPYIPTESIDMAGLTALKTEVDYVPLAQNELSASIWADYQTGAAIGSSDDVMLGEHEKALLARFHSSPDELTIEERRNALTLEIASKYLEWDRVSQHGGSGSNTDGQILNSIRTDVTILNDQLKKLAKENDLALPAICDRNDLPFTDYSYMLMSSAQSEERMDLLKNHYKTIVNPQDMERIKKANGYEPFTQETLQAALQIQSQQQPSAAAQESDPAPAEPIQSVPPASGPKRVFQKNIQAIRVLKQLEKENREATLEEYETLKEFAGFGGIPDAFDPSKANWAAEYKELKDLLTDAEYTASRSTVLNAHFTPDGVIKEMYHGLQKLGFQNGSILEPSMGVGGFFKNMPQEMQQDSHLYGVELDSLTGRMAKHLYPNAEVNIQGFETTKYKDHSFDLAVGNVPFGNYKLLDPKYSKENFLIHDYFLAKMMDQVRPGGLVAAITSHGTMDKKDSKTREYLARRGELVRAIRLPNNAFKAAGTEVTTDILLFKKREFILQEDAVLPAWVHSEPFQGESDITVNPYFVEHPEDIMGSLEKQSTAFGYDVTCRPDQNRSLEEQLSEAMERFTEIYRPSSMERDLPKQLGSEAAARPYSFFYQEGKLHFKSANASHPIEGLTNQQEAKIQQAIQVCEAIRQVIELQKMGADDQTLGDAQTSLTQKYDAYVEKYGHIQEDTGLKKIFGEDSSYPLLRTLEIYKKDQFQGKSPIFRTRTITPYVDPDHADTAIDALKISMTEKAKVDLPYMARLMGEEATPKSIVDELNYKHIFYDFESNTYQFADEYLSGDIREKIEFLENTRSSMLENNEAIAKDEIIPWSDENPEYVPQNEDEQRILKKSLTNLSISDHEDIAYLQEHSTNRALFMQIAIRYHQPVSALQIGGYEQDPSFALEYYKRGKAPVDRTLGCRLLRGTLDDMGIRRSRFSGLDANDATLYHFLRKKFTEYQSNPEALDGDIAAEWQDYQKTVETRISEAIINPTNPTIQANNESIEPMRKNIEALKKVMPKDLEPSDIQIELGAPWLPTEDIKQFLVNTLEPTYSEQNKIDVLYSSATGAWKIQGKNIGNGNAKAEKTYGTEYMNAYTLVESALNLKDAKVYKTIYVDGAEKRVVNQKETILAQQKQELLKNEFSKWLWKDPARRKRIAAYYNRHFNNIRPREYNGEGLTFPGMSAEIKLRKHQKDAIAHTLFGGNTLLAHSVGAGKTFEMVASIMESKRLGLSNKALVVVPKHLTEQFGNEFLQLYPSAKVLVATQKDFEAANRKEFCAKVATQNWDAVVMGPTQFERIPMKPERLKKLLQDEIDELLEGIADVKNANGETFTIKQMEMVKKKLETRLAALETIQSDQTINFEDLGIDRLYVDEAHYYKNLFTSTKMSNIPGISTTDAKKTTDMYEKCRYLSEKNGGKGIVFATGTAISNSMTELYTMQRYLQPDRLREEGLTSFDAWASTFGKTVTAVELSPEGKGFRSKTRFAKFQNLPELMSMFKEIADIKTADVLKLPVPEAEFIVSRIPPSEEQKAMVNDLADRAADIRNGNVNPAIDNMLKITNEGRKLALDQRLMNPALPDNPNSKVNICVSNVMNVYKETMDKRSTQMIFCDLSTPNKDSFNVYDDIKQKLIHQGIPEDEIAFIHDAKNEKQKDAMFAKVRSGEIRVILGSTLMMGTGTNVQDKLVAMHDLDVPWRPSDLEQRSGRIIRQGNENEKVKIFRYVTEGTFDAYLWQIIENKQRFISQILTSKTPVRTAEDIDEATLSYAEIKAIATGNPLIKEKMNLDIQLEKLKLARVSHLSNQHDLERQIQEKLPAKIESYQSHIFLLEEDKIQMQQNTQMLDGVPVFNLKLNGKVFIDRKEAAAALSKAVENKNVLQLKGEFRGFKLQGAFNSMFDNYELVLSHKNTFRVTAYNAGGTTLNHMEDLAKKIEYELNSAKDNLIGEQERLELAQKAVNEPFPQEDEYQKKILRVKEIDAKLNLDEQKLDKKEEQGKRLEGVLSNEWYDKNTMLTTFVTFAKRQLKKNPTKWSETYDSEAAGYMLANGGSKEEVIDTLFKYSPSVPEKESLEKLVIKAQKNLSFAASR